MHVPPLIAAAIHTKRSAGVGLARQLWQSARLRLGRERLDPWEYYFFEVFLDRYSMPEKRRFIGWRREIELDRIANVGPSRDFANDKLAFHRLMQDHGAPLPRLIAVFGPLPQIPAAVRRLRSRQDLIRFLGDRDNLPLVIKPVRGARGRNIFIAERLSESGEELELRGRKPIKVDDFADICEQQSASGWLFQEVLRSHDNVNRLCGDRLTSVRLLIVVNDGAPELLSAVWRIPSGDNIVDNFDIGHTGNLIGDVDLITGDLGRVVQGNGWTVFPLTHHPDTDTAFQSASIPDWTPLTRLCLEHAGHFPGLCLQHWDIAVTHQGPVFLELNVEGGLRTHQIVQQRGIYSGPLAVLAMRAYR